MQDETGSDKNDDRIRLLAPIAEVRRSELGPAVVSLLWIFLAITAYYIIKPIRGQALQDLIGVDNKPTALVATTIFIGFFAYGYGKIVPRVERPKLIVGTYVIFLACIAAFAVALTSAGALTGYIFFVWVSTFSVMIVSQFWALEADIWTRDEGARLFAFIGLGTVSGGIAGSALTKVAKSLPTWQMLAVSGGILLICLPMALYILRYGARKQSAAAAAAAAEAPKKDAAPEKPEKEVNAISMVLGSPYLRLIAAMTLILNLVNSNNEWILDKLFGLQGDGDSRTFYADFYFWQNLLTAFIQFFITGRIQRRFGARVALLFLPLVGMLGGSAFLLVPTLAVIRGMKIAENATDYSIQSNTREFLYLPTTKLEKYAAKNVNDTFVVRMGDLVAAGSIEVAKILILQIPEAGLKVLVGVNLVLAAAWLFIVVRIGVLNGRLMQERGKA